MDGAMTLHHTKQNHVNCTGFLTAKIVSLSGFELIFPVEKLLSKVLRIWQ